MKIQKGNKEAKAVNLVNPTMTKRVRLYLGWLHRTSSKSFYKQIRTKDDGVARDIYHKEDKDISVESLQMMVAQLLGHLGTGPGQEQQRLDDWCVVFINRNVGIFDLLFVSTPN
ncbi:hypothetical protein ACROYT_G014927 [Oculina patagonica]